MLERIFSELGPWNWMVLGLVLLALESSLPGFFLLWIGIAALLTGALSLLFWDATFWVWAVQVAGLPGALARRGLCRQAGSCAAAATIPTSRCSTGAASSCRPAGDAGRADHGRTRPHPHRRHAVAGYWPDLPAGRRCGSKAAAASRSRAGGRACVAERRDCSRRCDAASGHADPQQIVEMDDADRPRRLRRRSAR